MFQRLRQAWWVLRGQVTFHDEPDATEDVLDITELTLKGARATGPVYLVQCQMNPRDVFAVRGVRAGDRGAVVFAAKSEDGQEVEAVVFPAHARQFAAGVLNAADEVDGTTPLVFADSNIVPGVQAVLDLIEGERARGLDDARVLVAVEDWARQVVSAGQEVDE